MRLGDVDHKKRHAVAILLVQLVEGGHLPPERRSSVAAENEHDRASLRGETRELHMIGLVELGKREVGRGIADFESSGASVLPQRFEWKNEESDGPWDSRHD